MQKILSLQFINLKNKKKYTRQNLYELKDLTHSL